MKRIELSPAAFRAVQRRATLPFRDTSTLLPNGNRRIEIADDTFQRLEKIRLPGESFSDAVERLCATAGKPLN